MYLSFIRNLIDDPENIKHQPVFIGVDAQDNIINAKYEHALSYFYQNTGSQLKSEEF